VVGPDVHRRNDLSGETNYLLITQPGHPSMGRCATSTASAKARTKTGAARAVQQACIPGLALKTGLWP